MVFIDTSALYAVLDRDDKNHGKAAKIWAWLLTSAVPLFTHNYVLVETAALAQHRLGIPALRAVHERMIPVLQIHWVHESHHRIATEMVMTTGRRKLSLVDCVSFVVMRENSTSDVFCFDNHFIEQGFHLLTVDL
jgi:predicted nucleic acid-binding protein